MLRSLLVIALLAGVLVDAGCPFASVTSSSPPHTLTHTTSTLDTGSDLTSRPSSPPQRVTVVADVLSSGDGDDPDPLVRANKLMAQYYASNKDTLLESMMSGGQIALLVTGGFSHHLYQGGELVETYHTGSHVYDNLKLVSHLTLASVSLLAPVLEMSSEDEVVVVPQETMTQISAYLNELRGVMDTLDSRGLTAEQVDRCTRIVAASWQLLQDALQDGTIRRSVYKAWGDSMRDMIASNIRDSADDAVQKLHEAMQTMKETYFTVRNADGSTTVDMSNLYVVARVSHMARTNQMNVQYFSRMLDTPQNTGSEAGGSMDEIKSLLAVHLIDHAAGRAIFGSPDRMHQDILAPATRHKLDELFPDAHDHWVDTGAPGTESSPCPSATTVDDKKCEPETWKLIVVLVIGLISGGVIGYFAHKRQWFGESSSGNPYYEMSSERM